MRKFEIRSGVKEVAVAQLRVHENDYDTMSCEQITANVNHFLKINDTNSSVCLQNKTLYRDITIGQNKKLRFSTKDKFVTITYIKLEHNYAVIETDN